MNLKTKEVQIYKYKFTLLLTLRNTLMILNNLIRKIIFFSFNESREQIFQWVFGSCISHSTL